MQKYQEGQEVVQSSLAVHHGLIHPEKVRDDTDYSATQFQSKETPTQAMVL